MKLEPFHRRGAPFQPSGPISPGWTGVAVALALTIFIGSCCYLVVQWIDRHTCHLSITTRR